LTSAVRPSLGRMIVQSLTDIGEDMSVMTLEPDLEQLLHNVLTQGSGGDNIEPNLAEQLLTNLYTASEELVEQGIQPILIVSPSVRPWVAKFVRHRVPGLAVLGFNEIPDEQGIKVVMSGEMDLLSIDISDNLLAPGKKADLQKSLVKIINKASQQAKTMASSKLSSVSKGLDIPGL